MKGKICIIELFQRTYLVICSHSGEEKTLSYSQINTVMYSFLLIIKVKLARDYLVQ